jgi:predicted Zn-dependent protease
MKRNSPISPIRLSVLAFVLLLAGYGNAQNRSSISGFIFGADRRPVSQVIVELRGEFSTLGRMRTDGSGRYYFGSLAHGRYTVKVLPMGTPFMETSEDVEIAGTGIRGQSVTDNVQKDIYLRPRKGSDSIPFQATVVYVQDVPKEAQDLYKRATEDLESGRVLTGIASLEKSVAVFPDYFMALQRLGIVRLTEERFDDAITIFSRALKINSRCFDCLYGIAYANYTTRKFQDAVDPAQRSVTEKPESVEAHLLLGMIFRMTKDFGRSEAALKMAAKIADGSSPDIHWNLALLYGKDMNKFAEAAKELETFLRLSPEAPNKEDIKKLIKQFKDKAKPQS